MNGPTGARDLRRDDEYFELVANPLRLCAQYKPKFGKGSSSGLELTEFQELYRQDPFYCWVGLDSQLMYAAHKAAGGMTSIYRQLGIGCQWLVNRVLRDHLGLTAEQAAWSYELPMPKGKARKLSLDGRIELAHVRGEQPRARAAEWLAAAQEHLRLAKDVRRSLKGVVFEIRQGYKSMDSKRQNADIANAANAYAYQYVPVLLLLSTQIDQALIQRYSQARWLMLSGTLQGSTTQSTYAFAREVLGYDLAAFFERNSDRFKAELEKILSALLEV